MLNMAEFLFFAIPIGAIVFFVISLHKYQEARAMEKCSPGSVPKKKLTWLKIMLILSSTVAGVLAAVVIAFIVLMCFAVAYM